MRELSAEDVNHIATGAQFLTCSINPSGMFLYADLTRRAMSSGTIRLAMVDEFDDDALVVAVGVITNGLLPAEMPPCGDEVLGCLSAVEAAVGRPISAVYPLAAANVNAIVPLLASLQAGIPVVDADAMGRVFPLISQTTLNAGGVRIGPIALMSATGDRITIQVEGAQRAEGLVRAATQELGGWAASAMYPCTARELREHGVVGSISRLQGLGEVLDNPGAIPANYRSLGETSNTSVIAHAQVTHVESRFGASEVALPAQPSSITLVDSANGRIVRLEIQNEILAVLVDGAIASAVPDVISLVDPQQGGIISVDDIRVGDTVDILRTPADPKWYTPAGLALAGPSAFGF